MIVSKIKRLRDPFILLEGDYYYAYGTDWHCFRAKELNGDWEDLGVVVEYPKDFDTNPWAPEVHKYNGAYYMFTTYKSTVTHHRGCTFFRSEHPKGPFVQISNGAITPSEWDAIDGTLYVDADGQPYMVFVHEWTSMPDKIGAMVAAKMSDDLSRLISEPIELFRANDPTWSNHNVTDDCFLYTTKEGKLLMIWSNFTPDPTSPHGHSYAVGIAESTTGKVDGPWVHQDKMLFCRAMNRNSYDGGHGMIFTSKEGEQYLAIHSPNSAVYGRDETPVFIPIREENGTLILNLSDEKEN